jgi:alcohol dehydrogenase class IV
MNINAKASEGVKWVKEILKILDIPPLSYYGLTPEIFPDLAEKACKSSSMQGNPVKLASEEITNILELSF